MAVHITYICKRKFWLFIEYIFVNERSGCGSNEMQFYGDNKDIRPTKVIFLLLN